MDPKELKFPWKTHALERERLNEALVPDKGEISFPEEISHSSDNLQGRPEPRQ